MTVHRTGDWGLARRILSRGPARLKHAITIAVRQEAHLLRKEIVEGITKQAPGDEPILPPSPLTLAARELKRFTGTKALIVRGDLRNSITVVFDGTSAWIGVSRTARTKDGKSVVNIAEIQEFGAGPTIIPMTDAMRRFLFLLLRKAGVPPRGGSGSGVVVVSILPRPFLQPAIRKWSKGAQRRFLERVARQLGIGGW